ncbi:hypothetical protein [Desulfonatronovibrio hydrogenovorans]|uniref:hypothetical protein n=1 Tax=Desulfonatronovibrio hydrogenovorans TaxID=53245 RepID=UPI0012373AB2|nr:hypothetical protein [Desulfonatronovibrio hydrogenovorans]
MRIYGEIKGLDPERISFLQRIDLDPFELNGLNLEVEHEGRFLDIEPLLDEIVACMAENGQGYVDCIDHDHWIVLRYDLKPGKWTCKRINPDISLEKYHQE